MPGPVTAMHVPGRNRVLDLLPPDERTRLLARMERITGKLGDIVFARNEPIQQVDFPLGAVVSIVVIMEDGAIAEAGTVGNEGMAGIPLVLGASRSPMQAFYQVPGAAMRMSARVFCEELARGGPFRDVVQRYAQSFLVQVAQAAACNRLHPIDQRLARWILMSHDRVGSDKLLLTQDILAQMLGVRRASVTIAAGMLQKAGFIRYRRGLIEILDRGGLESSSCECYGIVRGELERLLS